MAYISFPTLELLPMGVTQRTKSNSRFPKVKTAGVIGGLAPQSTSLFYETITQYCLERNLPAFPRLLINSVNTWDVTKILAEKDMDKLFTYLKKEINLIQNQVDFLVMVCNSVHAVLNPIRKIMDIPVLSIHEEVCKEIALSTIKKIGILATKTTLDHNFYQQELSSYGIDFIALPEEQAIAFDAFIFEEMLHGRGEGTMKRLLLEGIQYMKKQGCEGVILACTELPLFLGQEDTDIPLFLSTQILANAVMEECYRNFGD